MKNGFLSVIFLAGILALPGSLALAQSPAPESSPVYLIYLQSQPQAETAQTVQAEYAAQQSQLTLQLQQSGGQLAAAAARPLLATRDEEVAYAQQHQVRLSSADESARLAAMQAMEESQRNLRREIISRSETTRTASQDRVAQWVSDHGGQEVYRYQVINAIAVTLPPEHLAALQTHPDVAEVVADSLRHADMNVSPTSMGANTWWNSGYTGGPWDVAVIDSGIDNNHPALSTQDFIEKRCINAVNAYWDPTPDDINGHGTHIAGTIASTNSYYKGVAYGLGTLINGKAAFNYGNSASMVDSDAMSCINWALTNSYDDADVINLSYGSTAYYDDGGYERFWDAVVDQMDAVAAIAAGNSGPSNYTIGTPSTAYNVISVANVDDKNTTSRTDDLIASSSSRGPTPNGRKKPDLAAPGTNIYSANYDWEYYSDFFNATGTSMAAPHVAGAAALLMSRGIFDPMAIKAMLINTAEDKGTSGWDSAYGWGYIDLAHLDSHPFDVFWGSVKTRPDYKFYAGPAYTSDNATLVWHRRALYNYASYPYTAYPLTDLDLYMYNEATNGVIASSVSGQDNVEQVRANANYSNVVLKVDGYSSTIYGRSSENYTLATEEGFTAKNGPNLEIVNTTVYGDVEGPIGTYITVYATVKNTGDLRTHNVWLELSYSSGLSKVSGSSPIYIGSSLAAGASSSSYSWLFMKTASTPQVISLKAISDAYGEDFNATWREGGYSVYLPAVIK